MSFAQRVDDFRCHDPRLVRVLPDREYESAKFAAELATRGMCDGVFVQGKEVEDWSFLSELSRLDRFEFVNINRSFKSADLSAIHNATYLRIVGEKFDIDFSPFHRLQTLAYQWSGKSRGLGGLECLSELYLYEIGKALNARALDLSPSVEQLALVGFGHGEIVLGQCVRYLKKLSLIYSRGLSRLPTLEMLTELVLKNVGKDGFDYRSVPESVSDLEVDSCAPIVDWSFILGMFQLRRLVVSGTKCAPIPRQVMQRLEGVDVVELPRSVRCD